MEHLPAADLGLTVAQETNIEKIIKCIICNFKLFIPLLLYNVLLTFWFITNILKYHILLLQRKK